MKKSIKKVVIASTIILASGAVIVSSMKSPQPSILLTDRQAHTDMWAANSVPTSHRSALPPVRGKSRATPVKIKDPFDSLESGRLNKKSKGSSGSQKGRARKPIGAKDEFMPEITDIPTASNDLNASPGQVKQQSRWIKELSGKNARIQMAGVHKKVDTCDQEHLEACANQRNDPSITVAGIVVQTESVPRGALETQRLEGEMARGSYAEDRPIVYLK